MFSFFHPASQRIRVQAQYQSRSFGAFDDPICIPQNLQDVTVRSI